MTLSLTVPVVNTPSRPSCDACPFAQCRFSVPRVRFYLVIWRLAQIMREPFDLVFASESKTSSASDPWIRGSRGAGDMPQLIRLSLERARDEGRIPLTQWNTEKIAAYLCPDRHNESSS